MCGIIGEFLAGGRIADSAAITAGAAAMAPRGPDGQGVFAQGAVALGHRRLKIIDLSDRAAQPMTDPDLGLAIIFNGIIYNYKELRTDLRARGHRFFSGGDTEVVLKAFAEWGPGCVERFHGMFAFAVWERETGRLTIARDRLGIKPLYLQQIEGGIRFASALPALLAAGRVSHPPATDIDPIALNHYMNFHSIVPPPRTIFTGVQKLPPATVAVFEADGARTDRLYWTPRFERDSVEQRLTADDWREMTLEALTRAVERRLVADVPVGVLLSGGLDSSLVVGLLSTLGQTGLKTFSIGFETVGDEKGDEFAYSDIIAERFDTDHTKLFIDSRRALPALDACVAAMNEPMVSHDCIGFFLLSEEVSRHVRVVQSGQGADEVFAGYHWYPPMMDAQDAVADYARHFLDREHEEYLRAVSPAFHGADHARAFVAERFALEGAEAPIDKALRLDSTVMLVDDPVKRVDNMTMAWGLEARVPFLDHELVETAARIPPELKVKGGGKWILAEAARRVIPSEVIDRPKGYFPVPALKYLQGPYLDRVRDVLHAPAATQRGIFQPDYIAMLLAAPEQHITPLRGSKLWQCALLEYWLQTHLDA